MFVVKESDGGWSTDFGFDAQGWPIIVMVGTGVGYADADDQS